MVNYSFVGIEQSSKNNLTKLHEENLRKDTFMQNVIKLENIKSSCATPEKSENIGKIWIRTKQVCQKLGIHKSTVSKYVREGKITQYHFEGVPLYDASEIDARIKKTEFKKWQG